MTTLPAFTIGGITRPELLLDPNGNIVLTPAAQTFAGQYGLKALYLGVPPGTPFPPVPGSPIPTPVHSVSTPVDNDATANSVLENAAVNTPVNVTANSTSSAGAPIVYSLTADASGGGFKIDPNTGVVSVADSSKIDFESAPGHSYTITVQANDGIITSSQSFTIGVVNVNEAPSGTNATITTNEDTPRVLTVADFGYSDVEGNALANVHINAVSGSGLTLNGNPVAAGDVIPAAEIVAGHLVYTPPANASGSALAAFTFQVQDDGGTANGGHDLDPAAKTMTIDVASVNDAPSFTAGANQTVLERSGAHTVNGLATGISPGPADEAGQAVNFLITTDNDALFSVVPSIDASGNLTYTLAANAFGTATVTVRAHDNGGTANGGVDTSAGQTFTVTVTGVNDAPSFTVGPDQAAPEDSGAHTVNGFAGSISAGPNETGQALNFIVSNNNNALFSVQPSIDASGNLTYTPAANANGSATVSVALHDDGGTANGGADTSAVQTFTINVPAANDPPSFTVGADQITVEDSGAHTVNGFVTAISTGPADEAGQTVDFIVSNDNNAMFAVQPSIDASGNLTYTLAANANGNAVVSVQAHDNGGTANGGVDTSAAQTFNIAATAVNDAPVGTSTAVTILEDQSHTFTAAEFGFTDPADATSGSANTLLNLIITTLPGAGAGTLTLSDVPVVAGQSVAAANIGNLAFTPAANASGSPEASFTFQVQDDGGTANGGVDTDTAPKTFTFNVTPVNDAPAGTDKTVSSQGAHTFAATDFGFTDPLDSPANSLFAVEITTLPASGSLALNGAAVTAGQFISAADIASGLLVFTPLGNNPGSFTFQVQDNGGLANGGADLDPTPNTITLNQDTPPIVTAGHTLAYTENQAATAIDPALTVTDPDTPNLVSATVQITGNYVNGEDVLGFTTQNGITGSFNAATGTLTLTGSDTVANYQAALASVTYFNTSDNPSGAARTVTIITNDGTLDSAPATDTINVTPVNDAPVVTAGHTLSYSENQTATALDPALTVTDVDSANLASATVQITGNYFNGQDVLGFTDQNGITGSFNAATGTLTLTGSASVANYQAALGSVTYLNTSDNPSGAARTVTIITNDGTANSIAKTDTINVTPVNDAPVTTAGGTLNYTENQVATAINSTVTVADVDSASTASATVQISGNYISGQDILGFTNQNGITGSFNAATGTLTLTGSSSVANYKTALDSVTYFDNSDNPSGLDRTVSYTVNDGALNSNTSTSTIHVTPVNDAPVVNATGTLAYTENQAATAIAPALTLSDADNTTLTTASVQISANYVNGEDVLGFTNQNGITGSFNAATGTLTLSGLASVANYQAALASVTYTDTSDNPSTAARTVTFTADDGQAVNHLSAGSNHTINVTAVDDAPVNNGVPANFTVQSGFSHAITGLSISDVDAAGGNDITTTLTSAGGGSVNIGSVGGGAAITGNGTGVVTLTGTIAQINASLAGSVAYTAADGATGSSTTTLTIATNDHGHTGTGGPITDTDVIQVGVTQQVWFINGDQTGVDATAPRGSQTNPFTDVHEFNTSSGPGTNDIIYMKAGTYTGEGINLKDGQTLLGDDQALSLPDPFGGPAIVIETASGARPTIHVTTAGDQGVDLASGNTVSGINIQTDASTTGLDDGVGAGGGSVGSLTVNHMNITGAGQAVDIDQGGALNVAIDTLSSSGGAFGVQLGGALTGSFTGTTGTLSGHTTSEFDINGGTGNISYGGAINDGTGLSASVANHTGGTVAFSGGINDGADAGGGVALTSNTGGTINFTGGMTLNTGASNGFAATGGGTVNVTGTNHLTTATGTALNITNTTIGASNVTFQDVSSTGSSANAGIILDGTGSSGGLHVTGTGSAGSGGTISNKTGADILTGTDAGGQTTSGTNGVGIYLHNTSGVQLDRMQLNDFSNFAIYGNNVTNFSLDHSTISGTNGSNNAGDREESSVRFDNLLGTSSINNSSISGAYNQNVDLYNTGGTLARLTMDNDAFGLINATGGNDNVRGQVYNNATANYTVTNSTFAGTRSDFIAFLANNNATMDAVVRNNTFHNGQTIIPGGGTLVDVRSGSGGNVSAANTTYDISHNTALNTGADAANAFDTVGIFTAKGQDNGTMSGTIAGNTIGPAKANANADGIFVRSAGNGTDTVLIQDNTITGYGNNGIHLQNNDGSATMNASLFENVLSSPNSQNFAGIFADNGATAGDTSTMNLVVGSANPGESAKQNTLTGSGNVIDVSLSNFNASTHFNLSKNGSPSATATGVIQDDNVGSPSVDTSGGAGPINLVGTAPALPPAVAPLFAASGGVQASTPNAGEMHLTQGQLDSVVAAAIAQWAAAGASTSQLAALHATTFSIADLSGNTIGKEGAPSHITIDVDAAGHGWFVDPTPSDNFEFSHALNAAGTDRLADPTSAAAGHLDLLTTVSHEMGHVINLPDSTATRDAHDLMYINLVDGERRLPTAADVAQANAATFSPHTVGATAPPAPGSAPQAPASQPVTSDGGHFGWGADTFVFAPSGAATPMLGFAGFANVLKTTGVDFSTLFAAFHAPAFNDGAPVHLEGLGARLIAPQIDTRDVLPFHSMNSTPFDSHSAFHFELNHPGWLV